MRMPLLVLAISSGSSEVHGSSALFPTIERTNKLWQEDTIEATPKKSFEASQTRGGRCMCYKKRKINCQLLHKY
jgi:hypothetical protein